MTKKKAPVDGRDDVISRVLKGGPRGLRGGSGTGDRLAFCICLLWVHFRGAQFTRLLYLPIWHFSLSLRKWTEKNKSQVFVFCFLPFFLFSDTTIILSGTAALG